MNIHEWLYFIFPKRCLLCGSVINPDDETCGECEIKPCINLRTIPGIELCMTPFIYDEFSESINNYKLKYKNIDFAYRYAGYIDKMIHDNNEISGCDIICCVPSNNKDSHDFISAKYIAKYFAEKIKIKFISDLIVKTRKNEKQHYLSGRQREGNVRDLYKTNPKYDISSKNIIIIDDVITTGNTLRSCAKAAKAAGAGYVYALGVASTRDYDDENYKKSEIDILIEEILNVNKI